MADVAQTLAATNGVDGRVRNTTNSNLLAGITSWVRSSKTTTVRVLHYESPADTTTGVVQPTKLKGDGDSQVQISGIYNLTTASTTEGTATGLTNGAGVSLDLFGSRSGSGYPGVVGIISDFKVTSKMGPDLLAFDCTVEVSGVFPAWTNSMSV